MIRLVTDKGVEHIIKATIFPDGTSQVWKLPDDILQSRRHTVIWNFEAERELIDLVSLRAILPWEDYEWKLKVPYMPYARQDKPVSNVSTFNLAVAAMFINSLECEEVCSVDVHNEEAAAHLVTNFQNTQPNDFWRYVIEQSKPQCIVFPDAGAFERYKDVTPFHATFVMDKLTLVCEKDRDQLTGVIKGHKVILNPEWSIANSPLRRFLIIDDLCDGGATFISVANLLRGRFGGADTKIDLCVTHGIFSKGREALAGPIDQIYTTNSLLKNKGDYKV